MRTTDRVPSSPELDKSYPEEDKPIRTIDRAPSSPELDEDKPVSKITDKQLPSYLKTSSDIESPDLSLVMSSEIKKVTEIIYRGKELESIIETSTQEIQEQVEAIKNSNETPVQEKLVETQQAVFTILPELTLPMSPKKKNIPASARRKSKISIETNQKEESEAQKIDKGQVYVVDLTGGSDMELSDTEDQSKANVKILNVAPTTSEIQAHEISESNNEQDLIHSPKKNPEIQTNLCSEVVDTKNIKENPETKENTRVDEDIVMSTELIDPSSFEFLSKSTYHTSRKIRDGYTKIGQNLTEQTEELLLLSKQRLLQFNTELLTEYQLFYNTFNTK